MKKICPKLLLLTTVLIVCGVSGCKEIYLRNPFSTSPPIIIHPILGEDIFFIPITAIVDWNDIDLHDIGMDDKQIKTIRAKFGLDITPDGILLGDQIEVQKTGTFCSDYYNKEILRVKLE